MGARGRIAAGGLGLFLVLAGGAAFVTGIIRLPIGCEGPPSPTWDSPFGAAGTQVADLKEAAPYLAFTPVVPRALGSPSKLFIGGNKPDMSARHLIWVYEQPVYGRFWVEESIAEVVETDDWIKRMGQPNSTGCGENSLVTLRGGTKAALSVGNLVASGSGASTTSIMWLDHGLLMVALGPKKSFTKDHAIEVANQV